MVGEMGDEPASPARIRRAWRAGLRGRSAWLGTGIALVIAATVLRAWAPAPAEIAARVRVALVGGDASTFASALAVDALWLFGGIAAIACASMIVAGLALGRLGPIDVDRNLAIEQPPIRVRVGLGLGALLFVLGAFELRARMAGAARAADASADGLVALWHGSALELATAIGVAMIAVGVLEAWWARVDRLLVLRPTVEQARAEARDRGDRRR
jgi:hypothetical protein